MPENKSFLPEGTRFPDTYSLDALNSAKDKGTILEATVLRCDPDLNLHVMLGNIKGMIPRSETIAPWISGANRSIAILSCVGKSVCFSISDICPDKKGSPQLILSRKAAQETAMQYFRMHLTPGMILSCRITHLESFGAFLDIGCGIIAMLPIERISVARITHPKERFQVGQKILAAVLSFDRCTGRITMTHRELLGTWMENACNFQSGDTVQGIVRSTQTYGHFIELTPNLSGLADVYTPLSEGDRVSVFIKSIRPERMKIKLQVIEKLPAANQLPQLHYQITDGTLTRWIYSPPNYEKDPIATDFTACAL